MLAGLLRENIKKKMLAKSNNAKKKSASTIGKNLSGNETRIRIKISLEEKSNVYFWLDCRLTVSTGNLTQSSRRFWASVQFSLDSTRAFNDVIKIRKIEVLIT